MTSLRRMTTPDVLNTTGGYYGRSGDQDAILMRSCVLLDAPTRPQQASAVTQLPTDCPHP